ncbi:MAG: hypothetical protein Q8N51_06795, partial [Gammaproteobacteria bacterium]|nr:hypothetical protein [Gammaproteobacteria bacterium]
MTASEKTTLVAFALGLLLGLVIWTGSAVWRNAPPRELPLVTRAEAMRAGLTANSNASIRASKLLHPDRVVTLRDEIVVVGDGFTTAAIIANVPASRKIRVFGKPSYWPELHGVPTIWQTAGSLKDSFSKAGLTAPETLDPKAQPTDRLLWYAVETVRLEQLIKPNVERIECQSGFEVDADTASSRWRVTDRCTGLKYETSENVVIATGVNEQLELSPAPGVSAQTLAALFGQHMLVYADEYLSDPLERVDSRGIAVPLTEAGKTFAVAGPGGA